MAIQRGRRRLLELPANLPPERMTLTQMLYARGYAEQLVQRWKDTHPDFEMVGEGTAFHLLAKNGEELWFD